jgi:hypothetical protein
MPVTFVTGGGGAVGDPGTIDLDAVSDSGQSSTDNVTNINTPIFNLTIPPGDFLEGDIITAYVGGVAQTPHVVTAGEAGSQILALSLPSLADGTHNISFTYERDSEVSGQSNVVALTVDQTAGTISSVAFTSSAGGDQTYSVSDVVSVTVTFNSAQYVTGTPTLTVLCGVTNKTFNYASGSGTTALVFSYTIVSGDNDGDGLSIAANSLALAGGTITDLAGNNATLTHAAVANQAAHKVSTSIVVIDPGDERTDATDQATYTFTGVSFGAATAGNKLVIIGLTGHSSGVNRQFLSGTIDGSVAATVADNSTAGVVINVAAIIARVVAGSVTSGTVTITFSGGTVVRAGIAPFVLTNYLSTTPHDAFAEVKSDAVATHTATLDVPAGGVIFVVGGKTQNVAATWAGITDPELSDVQIGAEGARLSSAYYQAVGAETDHAATVTWGNTAGTRSIAAVSFR